MTVFFAQDRSAYLLNLKAVNAYLENGGHCELMSEEFKTRIFRNIEDAKKWIEESIQEAHPEMLITNAIDNWIWWLDDDKCFYFAEEKIDEYPDGKITPMTLH